MIDLVLHVQNVEYGVGISLDEQSDLLDVTANYVVPGGNLAQKKERGAYWSAR